MIIKSKEIQALNWEGLLISDFTSNQNTQSSFAKIKILSGTKHKISWSEVSEKIYYVLKGQLHFMIDNKDYVLNEGDLCIVPVNSKFAYMNKTDSPVETILIHSPKFDIGNEVFQDEYF
jgi:mannose-6-phosphate isomerase-like protein (cupin superfamily)